MMKIYISLVLLISFSACMNLEPRALKPSGMSLTEIDAKVKKQKEEGLVLEDFESTTKGWFGCSGGEIEVSGGALVAAFEEARFQCIGAKLKVNDLSDKPVIQLRIKASSETFNEPLTIVARMEDFDGDETNYDEQTYSLEVNKDYIDLELDFTGKLLSVNGDFDDQGIFKIKIFFNTKGSSPFTGTVLIDEIRAKGEKRVQN